MSDYQLAKQAIRNTAKTGKQIYPKYFDSLDYADRQAALEDFKKYTKCACGCRQFYKINRTVSRLKKGNEYVLVFYAHAGYSKDDFEEMGY